MKLKLKGKSMSIDKMRSRVIQGKLNTKKKVFSKKPIAEKNFPMLFRLKLPNLTDHITCYAQKMENFL